MASRNVSVGLSCLFSFYKIHLRNGGGVEIWSFLLFKIEFNLLKTPLGFSFSNCGSLNPSLGILLATFSPSLMFNLMKCPVLPIIPSRIRG